jgi:hypothetical protein
VPATPGQYRLSTRVTKPAEAALSTSVSADWTFRSANPGTATAVLPLWAVRFSVDLSNAMPAGRPVPLPLTVTSQPGSRPGKLRKLTVDVSFDDGATWTPAPVIRRPDGRGHAMVTNPTGASFASLRTHAEDSAGNAVDETIIRAYRITTDG